MVKKKNDIEDLIDNMISGSNDFVKRSKGVLPEYLSEPLEMFHETNVSNLKKIKELLNSK
jgi:hypothetical protein